MHLFIAFVASLAVILRVYFALSDDSILSLGFAVEIALDFVFFAVAIRLLLQRPLLRQAIWRVLFVCFALFTAMLMGGVGMLAILDASLLQAYEGWSLFWFLSGLFSHLVLMFGLYRYAYRSRGVWLGLQSVHQKILAYGPQVVGVKRQMNSGAQARYKRESQESTNAERIHTRP